MRLILIGADLTDNFAVELSVKLEQLRNVVSERLIRDFGVSEMTFEHQMEARLKGQRHSVKVRFEPTDNPGSCRSVFQNLCSNIWSRRARADD